jgi:hypothetical protein
VRAYSGPCVLPVRTTTPTADRACKRSESIVRDIRGMPRRMSLNRRLPDRSSHTMSKVHRPPNTSWARATEQNCHDCSSGKSSTTSQTQMVRILDQTRSESVKGIDHAEARPTAR